MLVYVGFMVFCTCVRASAFFSNRYFFAVVNMTAYGAQLVEKCESSVADWGQIIDDDGVDGCAVPVQPRDACGMTQLKPDYNETLAYKYCSFYGSFALADRGNCTFGEKAFVAQTNRYHGLIIVNYANESGPISAIAADKKYAPMVSIPVVSISYQCYAKVANYTFQKGYIFAVQSAFSTDLSKYLLPFVIILGICILIMFAGMIIKCVRERRQVMRRRLSRRDLRKIPTKKYTKGDHQDTCPICLDEYDEGDKLRVLPCSHVYHCKCVDPWLTKTRKVCPVCKRKVFSGDDSSSSEDEERTQQAQSEDGERNSERQPLLGGSSATTSPHREVGNSTFYTNYQSMQSSEANTPGEDTASSSADATAPVFHSRSVNASVAPLSVPCEISVRPKRRQKKTGHVPAGNPSSSDEEQAVGVAGSGASRQNLLVLSVEDSCRAPSTATSVSAVLHSLPSSVTAALRNGGASGGYSQLHNEADVEAFSAVGAALEEPQEQPAADSVVVNIAGAQMEGQQNNEQSRRFGNPEV